MTYTIGDLFGGLVLFVLIVLSIIGISEWAQGIRENSILEKCERQNNVFECEFIAVPKKGTKP